MSEIRKNIQLLPLSIYLVALVLTGCTDGLFHKMKSINPYYVKQWQKDRQVATTFEQRVEELLVLRTQLPSMDAQRQQTWAERLEALVRTDPSPEMRTMALQTIVLAQSPLRIQALNTASTDDSEKVRLAACAGWRQAGGPEARDMLQTLAVKSQETPSVRRAAIVALGDFDDQDSRATLVRLLDEKSPVLQYQAALSLKKITGRDFGGDIQAWRDYMNGQDVPEPNPSMLGKFWDSFSLTR